MTFFKSNARHSRKTAFSVIVYSLSFKYSSVCDMYFLGWWIDRVQIKIIWNEMKCSRRPWYSKKKSESHRAMEKPENLQTSNCSRLQQVHGWCGPNSGYSQSIVFTSWRDTKFPTMVKAKERETCYCLSKSLWEPLLPETRQPKGKDKICPRKIVWQMWAHTYPSRVKRIVIDVLWEKKYTKAKKNGETFKRQKTN